MKYSEAKKLKVGDHVWVHDRNSFVSATVPAVVMAIGELNPFTKGIFSEKRVVMAIAARFRNQEDVTQRYVDNLDLGNNSTYGIPKFRI